jgi:hypothetical protein
MDNGSPEVSKELAATLVATGNGSMLLLGEGVAESMTFPLSGNA